MYDDQKLTDEAKMRINEMTTSFLSDVKTEAKKRRPLPRDQLHELNTELATQVK